MKLVITSTDKKLEDLSKDTPEGVSKSNAGRRFYSCNTTRVRECEGSPITHSDRLIYGKQGRCRAG